MLAVSPTNLSTPLAYPSTLDRCPAAASYVEGCWSPVLAKCHCNLAGKSNTYRHARKSSVTLSRIFLSQAGPQVRIELLKLSITFWLVVVDSPSETKKATHWVALSCGGVYARSSEHTSRKGRNRRRTGAPDRSYAGTT
jgi:hypothetical protein